jgi:hypothetical protein
MLLPGTAAFAADPVGTWDLVGRVKLTVCARGRCQSQRQDDQGTLVIAADGTYTAPSDLAGCVAPDEYGTWVRRQRGQYLLKPLNVGDLVRAIQSCLGVSGLTLHGRFHDVFVPNADGTTATARNTFSGGGSYHGVVFTATATERYTGTRVLGSAGAFGASRVGVIAGLVANVLP